MSVPQPAEITSFRVALTQEERELYSRLFKTLDPESSGVITGEKARATFEKSGLPANILGEIWQLADSKNLGFLTQFGFCHAMRLIGYTQAGHFPTAQLAETPGPLPKFSDFPTTGQPLRSQSTSGSLLQAQPSSLIPQNTATQLSMPQAPIAPVSSADFEKFSQMYVKTTGSQTASLDGNTAKLILMKAKLPTVTLGQIWSLVDVNNRGFLDLPSFVMAMHLIHGLLSGTLKQLPPFLPEYVWKSVDLPGTARSSVDRQASYSSVNSQLSTIRHTPIRQSSRTATTNINAPAPTYSEWQVSALQKLQFDSIFESLDKTKSGSLAADQVASFLMTSRLDQLDLATIWDLSDIQNTGIFSKLEFGIALYLINRRRSGLSLPDVVPQELITSLLQTSAPAATSSNAQNQQYQSQQVKKSVPSIVLRSSFDELADIFASPSPGPQQSSPQKPSIQPRASSSDLTHSHEPPKVRQQLTSSFKPSSSFGQSLLGESRALAAPEHANLIGEDVPRSHVSQQPPKSISPAPETKQISAQENQGSHRSVDYEALRSVPTPPQARSSTTPVLNAAAPKAESFKDSFAPDTSRAVASQGNNDLLADSEVSGKLSEATSDIANFSNQIKSLTTQTSNLHEKKIRAEKELSRILAVKEEINTKLKQLRSSYANEVKQVEHVEQNLTLAKEELEALRSEASIAEAKFNSISSEFHEKQLAVEENQKINSSLKEKLGNLNAEIAALEKDHEKKAAENVRLSNEANVKKSQAQVALVKVDELKRKIAEAESQNAHYLDQIREYEFQRQNADLQSGDLQKQHENLSHGLKELELKHPLLTAGAGVAAGLIVTGAFSSAKSAIDNGEKDSELHKETKKNNKANDRSIVGSTSEEIAEEGNLPHETPKFSLGSETINPQADYVPYSVAGLVDEVKKHPAGDLTGLDDNAVVEHKNTLLDQETLGDARGHLPTSFEHPANDFMQTNYREESSKRESMSSTATGSYKQVDGNEVGETPITSPSTSEYRFQASSSGVVGGMVGMPGVLVGVQRTDSLTSSVQNNPSMSVRDDNIDEISDRDTLEDTAAFNDHPKEPKHSDGRFDETSEGERLSSGVELFEIVNADDAKGIERSRSPPKSLEGAIHPLAQSHRASEVSSGAGNQQAEEFPPVRELEYDESSSDEESEKNLAVGDQFDDAQDNFTSQVQPPSLISGSEFDDLKPAANENKSSTSQDEFFDEDFDNLKIADDDHQEDAEAQDVSIDDNFTGADDFGGFTQQGNVPDFSTSSQNAQSENDEWEQLFAGFGNAAPVADAHNPSLVKGNESHDAAVQELVAMGFEKATVVEALEKENFNVEAATNYLLDHA